MLCFRLLSEDEPAAPLAAAVEAVRTGKTAANVFDVDPVSFRQIPNAPFSYWVSERMRHLFREFPPLGRSVLVASGTGTLNDFRFLRLAWETHCDTRNYTWFPYAKGGVFSPYYYDYSLCVRWADNGAEMKAWVVVRYGGGHWARNIRSTEHYCRPGLTWPRRTQSGLALRAMPAGCVFADKGPAAFVESDDSEELLGLLALTNSQPFRGLVEIQMAFGSYEVGVMQRTVLPATTDPHLAAPAIQAWSIKRSRDTVNLTSHAFIAPALARPSATLDEAAAAWAASLAEAESNLADLQRQIDDTAYRLYGIGDDDRRAIEQMVGKEDGGKRAEGSLGDEEDEGEDEAPQADAAALVSALLDYALGAVFGRWDIRYATGAKLAPPEPDPFDPLPVCPPGMLQNSAGLPAGAGEVPTDYPLRITCSGILVDDKGHDKDIETRVREAIGVIWGERAEAITQEACELLGVATLRDFFRKPTGFFADHLKRYSKSRRQAPIYWPLSSPKNLYTVWLYYHRLTADTLFAVIRDHVTPKLQFEEGRAFGLRQEAVPSASPSQRREIAEADDLVTDLRTFRDELQRVAPLFKPDLNDGVIINHAPLWRMAGLPKWRKDLQVCWDKLAGGNYEWSHLAMRLWPERVTPKCATDRSLAIAHGLENFFWEEIPADELPKTKRSPGKSAKLKRARQLDPGLLDPEPAPVDEGEAAPDASSSGGSGKWRPKPVPAAEIQHLIDSRTSSAVKAALQALQSAPATRGTKSGRSRPGGAA